MVGRPKGSKNKKTVEKEAVSEPKKKQPVRLEEKIKAFADQQVEDTDMLHIPPEIIPEGMRYNWKTYSVFGQVQARRYGRFQMTGWEPVPASRHPGLFTPVGYEGNIEYDGLILMEKPEELCRQVEAREYIKAREQVQAKEQQLKGGDVGTTLDSRHKSALQSNKINRSYERFEVPEK
jgi:hypothetical protein